MPTDTELLGFILSSMSAHPESAFRPYVCWWRFQVEATPGDAEEGPREALERAYALYRTNLATAEQSPDIQF